MGSIENNTSVNSGGNVSVNRSFMKEFSHSSSRFNALKLEFAVMFCLNFLLVLLIFMMTNLTEHLFLYTLFILMVLTIFIIDIIYLFKKSQKSKFIYFVEIDDELRNLLELSEGYDDRLYLIESIIYVDGKESFIVQIYHKEEATSKKMIINPSIIRNKMIVAEQVETVKKKVKKAPKVAPVKKQTQVKNEPVRKASPVAPIVKEAPKETPIAAVQQTASERRSHKEQEKSRIKSEKEQKKIDKEVARLLVLEQKKLKKERKKNRRRNNALRKQELRNSARKEKRRRTKDMNQQFRYE